MQNLSFCTSEVKLQLLLHYILTVKVNTFSPCRYIILDQTLSKEM